MIRQDWSTLKKLMFAKTAAAGAAVTEATATGNPLTFLTDLARPLKSLLIPFTPVQSGSGDPSPQNIRSIIPWDGVEVDYTTKNYYTKNVNQSFDRYIRINLQTPIPAGSYVFTATVESTTTAPNCGVLFAKIENVGLVDILVPNHGRHSIPVTFTDDINYIYLYADKDWGAASGKSAIFSGIMITEQTPTVYPVSFPSTVYGGTLDVVSGVLTVEWVKYKLSDFTWSYVTTGGANAFRTSKLDSVMKASTSNVLLYCDTFNPVSAVTYYGGSANKPDLSIFQLSASDEKRIMVKDEAHTDPSDFRNTYGNVEICYALLTPQTVQLTPAQITALLGDNTIWSDADGQMTATYLKKG